METCVRRSAFKSASQLDLPSLLPLLYLSVDSLFDSLHQKPQASMLRCLISIIKPIALDTFIIKLVKQVADFVHGVLLHRW